MLYPDIEDSDFKDKQIKQMKAILEKQFGREPTLAEVNDALRTLRTFAGISYDMFVRDENRDRLLKDHPKGYHLEDGGTCKICSNHTKGNDSWYDKHGLKCMRCQDGINDKIIPISIIKDRQRKTWYSTYDLQEYFNIKDVDVKRYIKTSFLKARTVPGEGKRIHLQIFLIKENKDVLPPKEFIKSRMVKVIRDDKEYYTLAPWYEFFNEKEIRRLVKYRIIECFKETFAKPIDRGGLLIPVDGINPMFGFKELRELNS